MATMKNSIGSAQSGWLERLSRAASGILLFELTTGLAITFGPFHPAIEWGLILHTLIGLVAIAPLGWYCARHWRHYSDQALSDVLLLGYIGIGALCVCVVSGLLLTAQ